MSELPNIITANNYQSSPGFWGKYKKIILIVVGVIVLAEVAWGAYVLTRPSDQKVAVLPGLSSSDQKNAADPQGRIELLGFPEILTGESLVVDIKATLKKPVDGGDFIIKYDPQVLSVVLPSGKTSPVTTSSAFAEYPINSLDPVSGQISLSGIIAPGAKGPSGVISLGTVTFKALRPGTTTLTVVLDKESPTSSRLIDSETGGDILDSIESLEINIK